MARLKVGFDEGEGGVGGYREGWGEKGVGGGKRGGGMRDEGRGKGGGKG